MMSIQRRDNGRAIERESHKGWLGGHIPVDGHYLGDTMEIESHENSTRRGAIGCE